MLRNLIIFCLTVKTVSGIPTENALQQSDRESENRKSQVQCGVLSSDIEVNVRIAGGNEVMRGEFPWFVQKKLFNAKSLSIFALGWSQFL